PKLKKLTKIEEEVIIRYILNLDSRGFPPTLLAPHAKAGALALLSSTQLLGSTQLFDQIFLYNSNISTPPCLFTMGIQQMSSFVFKPALMTFLALKSSILLLRDATTVCRLRDFERV
ncbi:hypothetical protein BU23DRAFT_450808, partial [Bimuria novae-zelandiae CBS 107.79]